MIPQIKATLASDEPLTADMRRRVMDRICHLEREIASAQHSLHRLRKLIADDSHAMSFQSLGHYRTALLQNTIMGAADEVL